MKVIAPRVNIPQAASRAKSSRTDLQHILETLGLEADGDGVRLVRPDALSAASDHGALGHLAMIANVLVAPMDVGCQARDLRLSALVSECMNLHGGEALAMACMAGEALHEPLRTPETFHRALSEIIRQQRLHHLFTTTDHGEFHRGIIPSAYDERTGTVFGEEMAQWRANFREMAPERQMFAATIVWLYRAGPDSIWLRRVPCSWSAKEAVNYLRDAGCLPQWLRLLALYPGW